MRKRSSRWVGAGSNQLWRRVFGALLGAAVVLSSLPGCGGSAAAQPEPVIVTASTLAEMMADGKPLMVVDVDPPAAYEAAHIHGSVNLPNADIATWAKTLDKSQRICTVCSCLGTDGLSYTAAKTLLAQGFVAVSLLSGGKYSWPDLDASSTKVTALSPGELRALMADGQPLAIVDVRTPAEYATGHIAGSVNLPLGDIETWAPTLSVTERTCCVCAVGGRSRTAAAILLSKGFEAVFNLSGGMAAWEAAK